MKPIQSLGKRSDIAFDSGKGVEAGTSGLAITLIRQLDGESILAAQ